jgi:cytochrome c-type biogenesis protein CcmH
MKRTLLILIFIACPLANILATEIDPRTFTNAEQEKRYHDLTEQFRCVVCQNQSVAESNSKVALAIRALVYTKLQAGESDEAIKAHLVASYGDFVLYKPPLKPVTYFLWLGPLLILFIAFATLIYFVRRQTTETTTELTEEESKKISHLADDI